MKICHILLAILLLAAPNFSIAQWQQASTVVTQKVRCLYTRGGTLCAGGQGATQLPKDPTDIFVTGNGVTFNGMLMDENRAITIGSIVMNQSQKIIVGTLTNGLYQGINNAWTKITGITPAQQNVQALAEKGGIFFAGTDANGIYRSTDDGVTWSQTSGVSHIVRAILPTTGTSYFAGTEVGGIYRSGDGLTWAQSNTGLSSLSRSVYAFCEFKGKVYAGTETDMYVSGDNGTTWTALNTGLINIRSITTDGSSLFVGTINNTSGGLFRSTNPASSWEDISKDIGNKNVYSVALYGTNIYAATDAGVWQTAVSALTPTTPSTIDTNIQLFAGMDTTLVVAVGSGLRKYDWTYTTNGQTHNVVNGQFNFTKPNAFDSSYKWRAPFTDAEVAALNGSTTPKKLVVKCVVSDLNNTSVIFGTMTFTISVKPSLVSPDSNAQNIEPLTPNYTWHNIPKVQRYVVQIKADGGSYPTKGDVTVDTVMTFAPALPNLTSCSRFFWRVRVNDSLGPIIGERSFVTKCVPLTFSQNFADSTICTGQSIRLRASGQDGRIFPEPGRPYHYIWKMEDGSKIDTSIIVAGGGLFEDTLIIRSVGSIKIKCEVTDRQNNLTAHFTVVVGNVGSVAIQTSTSKLYFCTGSKLTLSLPQTFNSYQWWRGATPLVTTPTCEINTAGTYIVRVSSTGSCDATDTIVIEEKPLPAPVIIGAVGVCVGAKDVQYALDKVQFGDVFSWQVVEGAALVNAAGFGKSGKLDFNAAGQVKIHVTVTDSAGCEGTSQDLTITVGNALQPRLAGKSSFCVGQSVILDAGTGDTFQWFFNGAPITGQSQQKITVTQPGKYFAHVVSGSCEGNSDTLNITEAAAPSAVIGLNTATGELSVTDGTAWQWYTGKLPDTVVISGATSQTFLPPTSGDYSVKVTNAAGCSAAGTFNVPPTSTLGTFLLTDAAGSSAIQMAFSKTLTDVRTVELRASNMNPTAAAQLGVAAYRIKLTWYARTLGMANPPKPVVITNDTAAMEYDLPVSKAATDGTADKFSFLALIGGETTATITAEIAAINSAQQQIAQAKVQVQSAIVTIDSIALAKPKTAFSLVLIRPNPVEHEVSAEITSETGVISDELRVYITDVTGRKLAELTRKQGGSVFAGDVSGLPAGNYLVVAEANGSKQAKPLQIRR